MLHTTLLGCLLLVACDGRYLLVELNEKDDFKKYDQIQENGIETPRSFGRSLGK